MSFFQLHERIFDPSAVRMSSYFTQLFILTGTDYFQYSILDTEKNTFTGLADFRDEKKQAGPEIWAAEIESIFQSEELLRRKYPVVMIAYDVPYQVILPSSFYDPAKLEMHLNINFELPAGLHFHADPIAELNAWNVWAISPDAENFLKRLFPGGILLNAATPLIKYYASDQLQEDDKIHVNLHFTNKRFTLVIISDGKLQFQNIFSYDNDEDVLYFTLYAIEQLKLKASEVNLNLSGDVQMQSQIDQLLREYMPRIKYDSRPKGFGYSSLFEFPGHHYPSLFNLALCGS